MSSRISSFWFIAGLVLCAASLAAVPTRAAELTLTLSYLGSNTADFSNPYVIDLCKPYEPESLPFGPNDIHNFAVWMELTETAPGEDFSAVQYDVDTGFGSPADFGGFSQWSANNPLVDLNGPLPPSPTPLFSNNADIGPNDHDLVRLFAQTANSVLAADVEPGEDGPFLLGDFWVTGGVWTITIGPPGTNYLFPDLSVEPNGLHPWGVWANGIPEAQPDTSFHYGGFVHPRCVPEPASFALAGLATIGLLGLRRPGSRRTSSQHS